jgi:putative ABC transport system substrate-binding protein
MQAYTAELVSSAPDLIVASSTPVLATLKQSTRTIPIVFSVVNDPVGQGFIASLGRPGGNRLHIRRICPDREMAGDA